MRKFARPSSPISRNGGGSSPASSLKPLPAALAINSHAPMKSVFNSELYLRFDEPRRLIIFNALRKSARGPYPFGRQSPACAQIVHPAEGPGVTHLVTGRSVEAIDLARLEVIEARGESLALPLK